jgi:glyoxylase-like metal-dependent hydrolase (beta-lactamase superfamily II)
MKHAVLLTAALGAMTIPTGPARAAPEISESYAPYEARQLVDGVRLMAPAADYAGIATSNILIVEQRDGIVIVDSGVTRADGDRIVRYVQSFTRKPAKALIFTHWHNDHPQGASQVVAAWPKVRIIATDATRRGIDGPARTEGLGYAPNAAWEASIVKQLEDGIAAIGKLRDPANSDAQRRRYQAMADAYRDRIADFRGTHLVAPTEILTDEILLADPERPVAVKFLGRANTDGDAIVWLPDQRLVATGDVVVSPIPFGFFSYPGDWIATLGKIKALEFDILVPGHGLPQNDGAYIDRLTATITDIRTQVGALAAQGLALEDVRKKVDFSAQSAIFGSTPRRKLGFENLWLRPMIENAYKEAKGQPIIQGDGETP